MINILLFPQLTYLAAFVINSVTRSYSYSSIIFQINNAEIKIKVRKQITIQVRRKIQVQDQVTESIIPEEERPLQVTHVQQAETRG